MLDPFLQEAAAALIVVTRQREEYKALIVEATRNLNDASTLNARALATIKDQEKAIDVLQKTVAVGNELNAAKDKTIEILQEQIELLVRIDTAMQKHCDEKDKKIALLQQKLSLLKRYEELILKEAKCPPASTPTSDANSMTPSPP